MPAPEDRSGGFEHGGWMMPFGADPAFGEIVEGWFAHATALLFGRRTPAAPPAGMTLVDHRVARNGLVHLVLRPAAFAAGAAVVEHGRSAVRRT